MTMEALSKRMGQKIRHTDYRRKCEQIDDMRFNIHEMYQLFNGMTSIRPLDFLNLELLCYQKNIHIAFTVNNER